MHFTNLGAWCCILFEVAAADLIECLREKAAEASLPTLLESQLKSPLGGRPMMERSKLRCGDVQQLRSMGWGRGEHPSDYQLFEYRNQIDWLLASDMCAGRVANPSVENLAIPIVH